MRSSVKYPGVAIYEGKLGEAPKPGAFYAIKAGDVLARVSKAAGTTYAKVSAHPWNQANLVYVTKATNGMKCSPIAKTAAEKRSGFISFCKVGGVYQEIWIPSETGAGPDEVSAAVSTPSSPSSPGVPADFSERYKRLIRGPKALSAKLTAAQLAAEKQRALLNDGVAPVGPNISEDQEPVNAKMSTGLIVAMVGVGLAAVVLFFVKPKKTRS